LYPSSSFRCPVDILDPPSEFLNADTVSVLYRGGGELEGRYAILPLYDSSTMVSSTVSFGNEEEEDNNNNNNNNKTSSSNKSHMISTSSRYLCHSSDERWAWHRVKPR
jgi:hypothetical protein